MAKSVTLSAGHGAGDVGAQYKELTETALTVKITNRAVEIIRKHGLMCYDVPDSLTLQQTIDWINANTPNVNCCVEVHVNAGGGTGVEAWNYAGGPNESDKLSHFLADACAAETGLPNRGVKDESANRHGRLGFVHDTVPVAALVECGFIDGDYEFLRTEVGIEKMARGVARGILSYLSEPWRPELINPQPTPPPMSDAQRLSKVRELVWYNDPWWSSIWRVKEIRKILPL